MRAVIQQLAIFLVPNLLYAAYLYWRRARARAAGEPEPPWAQPRHPRPPRAQPAARPPRPPSPRPPSP